MNHGTINFILQQMTGCLKNSQMMKLQNGNVQFLRLSVGSCVPSSFC